MLINDPIQPLNKGIGMINLRDMANYLRETLIPLSFLWEIL